MIHNKIHHIRPGYLRYSLKSAESWPETPIILFPRLFIRNSCLVPGCFLVLAGCLRSSIALTVQNRGPKHHSFIHSKTCNYFFVLINFDNICNYSFLLINSPSIYLCLPTTGMRSRGRCMVGISLTTTTPNRILALCISHRCVTCVP